MKTLTIEDIANKYSLSLLLTFGSYNYFSLAGMK